jgi:hypothetical protein
MAEDQTLFASVIEQHLALKRRNAELEPDMPLEEFIPADPFDNHALFKTEADAQSEEEETGEHPAVRLEWDEDPLVDPTVEATGWAETTASGEFDWES